MNNIPEGYKLVPVEPTEDMRLAFADQIRTGDYNPGTLVGDLCAGIYTAMLAAAPTPPQPIYDEAKAVKDFEAWIPSFWNKEKYQDDEGDWLYSDDLVQGALVGWLACAQSRAKAGEDE